MRISTRTFAFLLSSCALALVAACGDDGGASTDAPRSSDASATIDGPSDAVGPDAAAPLGTTCTLGSECASGECVDGVCCDQACDSGCIACAAALTGGSDGVCAPVLVGTDPRDVCAADAATCGGAACDGFGACAAATAGTVCRPSAGACDQVESCDGVARQCPVDGFASAAQTCRASLGPCDPAETCSGAAAACPADVLASAATVCRAANGMCDVAESCTGASSACPADVLASTATVCRATNGMCDVAEACTGASSACPADVVASAAVVCRPSAGSCDVAESCTGTSATCPTDVVTASGVSCRASAGTCDVAEVCDGSSGACPTNQFQPRGAPLCAPYTCSGAGASCLTSCISSADCVVDARTVCDGGVCRAGKFAFVTSTVFTGATIGGLAMADATCQARAAVGGLSGTYKAWLSTDTSAASSRLTHATVPYVRTGDKLIIANSWTDLTDGTLDRPISLTEVGGVANGPVFTGTRTDGGTPGNFDCGDWTSTSGFGYVGTSSAINANWSQSNTQGACAGPARLYCFEQ